MSVEKKKKNWNKKIKQGTEMVRTVAAYWLCSRFNPSPAGMHGRYARSAEPRFVAEKKVVSTGV